MKLLVGTRKGLITFDLDGPTPRMLGVDHEAIPVTYAFSDARTGTTWASLQHGHWGPKLARRKAGGSWEEIAAPTYPDDATSHDAPATLKVGWVMAAGHPDQSKRIYLGTLPGGLFVSDDDGESWRLDRALWDHPHRSQWFGGGYDQPGIHSIVVDPRDARHRYVAVSCGGVYETRDDGETWSPRNQGLRADFLPDPATDVGHDPHFVTACASAPNVLWQQNHCGVFRSEDGGASWKDIGQPDGPVRFGFAVAAHDTRPERAWVIPAIADEKRIAIDGALQVCRTDDGGATWTSLREGLPQEGCFDLVYRHALDARGDTVAFGSTTGNLWLSRNGGDVWQCLSNHLPLIHSVRFEA